jgi:acetyl esterase
MFIEVAKQQNRPGWEELPIAESRELFAGFQSAYGVGPEMSSVEDRTMAGVPVRVYRPSNQEVLPCVVYFHGGGWVIGDLGTHDTLCRRLARESGCVVISVDYRLAPEHKYPAAMEDCYAVTQFTHANANELGIDAEKIVVAGDSAGGNLAVAVSLKARDQSGPPIALQILIYPVVEPNFETESYRAFAVNHGLTAKTMEWMWGLYFDDSVKADPKYVAVAKNDLRGLPPTHVVTAEYDILRDEGVAFVEQLSTASVPTTHKQYAGMLHGFVHFSGVFDDGVVAIGEIAEVIRKQIV